MEDSRKGRIRFRLMPGSTWVHSPEGGPRMEHRDGELVEVELDAQGKPLEENLRGLVDLGFAVVEG